LRQCTEKIKSIFCNAASQQKNAQSPVTHVTIKRALRRDFYQIAAFSRNLTRAFERLFNHAA